MTLCMRCARLNVKLTDDEWQKNHKLAMGVSPAFGQEAYAGKAHPFHGWFILPFTLATPNPIYTYHLCGLPLKVRFQGRREYQNR